MSNLVTIRQLAEDDMESVETFFKAIDHERYRRHFSPHPFTEEEAERVCHYSGRDRYLGVFLVPGDDMVGYGMLRGLDEGYEVPSVGVCIEEAHQGEGLGRMLLSHLLDLCVKQGANRAMAKVNRDNSASRAMFERARFAFEDFSPEFLVGYLELP